MGYSPCARFNFELALHLAATVQPSESNLMSRVKDRLGELRPAKRCRAPRASLPEGALDCVLGFNEHGAYCVPRSGHHRPAAQAILRSQVWERETIVLLQGIEGSIVSAGTFFGDFLPALARSRPHHRVWAFEPNNESYRCAQVTLCLNELQNVKLTHAGLATTPGTGFIQTRSPGGGALGGESHIVAALDITSEETPLTSIDATVTDPIAAIQLDVEGHEQEALMGAIDTLSRYRPVLVLETLPSGAWIAQHLTPLGYRDEGLVHGNHILRAA
jgi:FkbM family methyltransferase